MKLRYFVKGTPPNWDGMPTDSKHVVREGAEISESSLVEAVARAASQFGADITLYRGDEFDYSEKFWVRGAAGRFIMGISDDYDEILGEFDDAGRIGEPKIAIRGDLWDASGVATDPSIVIEAMTDFLEGRPLADRPYWYTYPK